MWLRVGLCVLLVGEQSVIFSDLHNYVEKLYYLILCIYRHVNALRCELQYPCVFSACLGVVAYGCICISLCIGNFLNNLPVILWPSCRW